MIAHLFTSILGVTPAVPPQDRESQYQPMVPWAAPQFSGALSLANYPSAWDTQWLLQLQRGPAVEPMVGLQIFSPALALSRIRTQLSLTIADLARALIVTRPTIYAWLEASAVLKPENHQRLVALQAVAEDWSRRSSGAALGKLLRMPLSGQPSLLEVISAPVWDATRVHQALTSALQAHETLRAAAGPTLAEIYDQRGLKPTPLTGQEIRDNLEWWAGRPI
jgi:transcriptional regulator with XRE-family HTH domain